jgi:hypothetical protein
MEYLAFHGASLGETIKYTHDGVVLGNGGRLPEFERLQAGMPAPRWTPADVMLKGTAARILFGDPALIVTDAFAAPPFTVTTQEEGDTLTVRAVLASPSLKSTYTDTYHDDLNRGRAPYNDRALIVTELPAGWEKVRAVEIAGVRAGGQLLPHRLVGYAVEQDAGRHRLHVQVDVPAQGFQQSVFRVAGATVDLTVHRRREQFQE